MEKRFTQKNIDEFNIKCDHGFTSGTFSDMHVLHFDQPHKFEDIFIVTNTKSNKKKTLLL
jgi:hypothetical protein